MIRSRLTHVQWLFVVAASGCASSTEVPGSIDGSYLAMGSAMAFRPSSATETVPGMGSVQLATRAPGETTLRLTVPLMGIDCSMNGTRSGDTVTLTAAQRCIVAARSPLTFTLASGSASVVAGRLSLSLSGAFTRQDDGDRGDWSLTATGMR